MTDSTNGEISPFAEQFEQAVAGIEAASRLDPYQSEVLRATHLAASNLIDEATTLKPVEQITYRRDIASLACKLAGEHADDTTAGEMEARVKDCDKILNLLQPQKPKRRKKQDSSHKADTSAKKTSGAKGA